MKLARTSSRAKQESTIALINIVFLMLIFFLVAGTLAPPLEAGVELIETQSAEPAAPPNALAMREDGSVIFQGSIISPNGFLQKRNDDQPFIKIVADQKAPAVKLLQLVSEIRTLTKKPVHLITRRAVN